LETDDGSGVPSGVMTHAPPPARRLGSVLEPVVGQVYFSPECHANYEALGFDASPGDADGVALPDGPAYFASRGSVLGQVPGEVIAAAFGVFNPAVVVPMVQLAWTRTDAATIRSARTDGAVAQLCRVLGEHPDGVERVRELLTRAAATLPLGGRPMAAGVASLDVPDDPLAAVWHLGDFVREYRGDCHNASWVAAGLTATDIGVLTELYWGLPKRSYSRTRAWNEADFDAADHHLADLGYLEGDHLTQAGHHAREQLEQLTDVQMAPAVVALGDDLDELCSLLEPWGASVRAAKGYLGAGPHDLAGASERRSP